MKLFTYSDTHLLLPRAAVQINHNVANEIRVHIV